MHQLEFGTSGGFLLLWRLSCFGSMLLFPGDFSTPPPPSWLIWWFQFSSTASGQQLQHLFLALARKPKPELHAVCSSQPGWGRFFRLRAYGRLVHKANKEVGKWEERRYIDGRWPQGNRNNRFKGGCSFGQFSQQDRNNNMSYLLSIISKHTGIGP